MLHRIEVEIPLAGTLFKDRCKNDTPVSGSCRNGSEDQPLSSPLPSAGKNGAPPLRLDPTGFPHS